MNKPKFNMMDGFIILALILIVLAGTFLLSGKNNSSGSGEVRNSVANYQVLLTKYDKAVADAFVLACENGEIAAVSEKESFSAKIIDVEVSQTKTSVVNERTKKAVLAEDPTTCDILVTLESSVVETDSSITASGNLIAVGEEITIKSKSAAGIGYITNLEIKD